MVTKRSKIAGALSASLVGLWGSIVAVVSVYGGFRHLSPYALVTIVAGGIVLPAVAYFMSFSLRELLAKVGVRWITAFHIWRIPAALVFFWYGSRHLLPATFVDRAGWGDFVSGVLAFLVVVLWPRRAGYWAFHLVGMLDFVVAVWTGLTLTLALNPEMRVITELPVVLIPFFGVGLSGASHIIAFHLLTTSQGHANLPDRTLGMKAKTV